MKRLLSRRPRQGLFRRLGLTLIVAALLVVALWCTQAPDSAAWMQGRWQDASDWIAPQWRVANGTVKRRVKTDVAAAPTILIVRPDNPGAADSARRFIDAFTDADLYPSIETVLIGSVQDDAASCSTASKPLQAPSSGLFDRVAPARVVYAIGPCAFQQALASARYAQRLAALRVGLVDEDEARADKVILVFSDIAELDARVLLPLAQSGGYTVDGAVDGVLAAPTLATQWRWVRRYLPEGRPLRVGYWSDALAVSPAVSVTAGASLSQATASTGYSSAMPQQRLADLRDAANEGGAGHDKRSGPVVDDDDAPRGDVIDDAARSIDLIAAAGKTTDVIAQWRAAGVRMLYVDAQTPVRVAQAALHAGIGTFCAADTAARPAMQGSCLLRVIPLPQAAPVMAAFLTSRLLQGAQMHLSVPTTEANPAWQGLPQGPLRLDLGLARKLRQMPPLSLLDDMQIVDAETDALTRRSTDGQTEAPQRP